MNNTTTVLPYTTVLPTTLANATDIDHMSDEEFQRTLIDDSVKFYREYFKPTLQKLMTFTFMAFIGIIGNVMTCVVIYTNKPLHDATHCYLFNLAVTDIMALFWDFPLNPQFLEHEATFDVKNVVAIAPINVTILMVTAFGLERYLAICHPVRTKLQLSTIPRAKKVIVVVWLIGLTGAIPPSMNLGMMKEVNKAGVTVFHVINAMDLQTAALVLLFAFVVPMFLVCGMYGRIVWEVTRMARAVMNELELQPQQQQQNQPQQQQRRTESRPKVTIPKMLMVVTAMFIITWTPILLERFLVVHGALIPMKNKLKRIAHSVFLEISEVMHYSSSWINPLIYSVMSKKFRDGVMNTFFCSNRRRRSS